MKKIKIDKTPVLCDVCKRNMKDKNGTTHIGFNSSVNFETDEDVKRWLGIYPELTKVDYNICWICWLKSMGIKF
jgi:hypothetical protein